jgi:DNA-binding transcriptional ArsR family regulator
MDLIIGRAGEKEFSVDAQELVTGRTCIIAQSGAGKSWAIAVICERLCQGGIGFCIIDTEGEYFSLRDKYHLLWLGSDEHADMDIDKVNIRDVMTKAVKNSTAVIFDVSETEMRERVSELAHALYEIESEIRLPYLLIIEEADKFSPQSRDSLKKIEEISRRGRKRGLGMLVATQRPSLVNKNVLSQCNSQIIGKLSIENDLRAVDLFFSSRSEVEELATLEPGEFFIMGKITPRKTRVSFASRETKHQGLTPRLSPHPPAVATPFPVREKAPPAAAELPTPGRDRGNQGISPSISREQALEIAHQRKKRGFLGRKEEHIVSVALVFWPIISVEGKYLGGLLHTAPREISFLLDGRGGRIVQIPAGLTVRGDLSPLYGLASEAVIVFRHLPMRGATVADLEARTKLPQATIREALRRLMEKKLITDGGSISSTRFYVPLVKLTLPRLWFLHQKWNQRVAPLSSEVRGCLVQKEDIRSILKGLEPTVEILSWITWYYPLYEILLSSDTDDRKIYVDGLTGKSVPFSDTV